MPPKINLTGQLFGKLIVLYESPNRHNGGSVEWYCKCECGNVKSIASASLRSGNSTSCGCYGLEMLAKHRIKHGKCPRSGRSAEYVVWDAMIQRCTNPNNEVYHHYGGRGIQIFEPWLDFANFYKDVGNRPSSRYTLDRIDNNGNYEPGNIRWATIKTQSRNKRSNFWIEYNGIKMIITDWAAKLGAGASSIARSLKRGKSFEDIYKFYMNKR